MTLRACLGCRRHFASEAACPFCGAAAPPAPRVAQPSTLSRAAIFAALSAGCYTSNPPVQEPPPPPPPPHEQPQDTQQDQFAEPPPPTDPPPATGGARVEGIVTASNGSGPMRQLLVTLQLPGAAEAERRTNTDANGRYVFDRLPPGTYTLVFGYRNHPRRPPPQQQVTVAKDATQTVNFTYYIQPPSNVPMPYGAPPARRRIV